MAFEVYINHIDLSVGPIFTFLFYFLLSFLGVSHVQPSKHYPFQFFY